MTRWRQRLHQDPEAAFQENKTARFINQRLRAIGVDEVHVVGKTGIVAVLHGSENATGAAIMLRAELDAQKGTEETGLPHASRQAGVHHSSGHDGHAAMLLGAAKYLADTRNFSGTVYLLFQPGEEQGGMQMLLDEGLLEKFPCQAVYALHNKPDLPLGTMATDKNALLPCADTFSITLTGKGGDLFDPTVLTDVLSCASDIVNHVRQGEDSLPKDAPGLFRVTVFQTGDKEANRLSDRAVLAGILRTFDADIQAQYKKELQDALISAAARHGVQAQITFAASTPALVNAQAETDFARQVAADTVGLDKVVILQKGLAVEGFSALLEKTPGNYMVIGTGPMAGAKQPAVPLRSARYDFNDAALPIGASYWARLVEKALPLSSASKPPSSKPPIP